MPAAEPPQCCKSSDENDHAELGGEEDLMLSPQAVRQALRSRTEIGEEHGERTERVDQAVGPAIDEGVAVRKIIRPFESGPEDSILWMEDLLRQLTSSVPPDQLFLGEE